MIELIKCLWLGLFLPLRRWADKHAQVHTAELRRLGQLMHNNPESADEIVLSQEHKDAVNSLNRWNGVSRFLWRISGGAGYV